MHGMTYLEALLVFLLALSTVGGPTVFFFLRGLGDLALLVGGNNVLGRSLALALIVGFLPLVLLAIVLYVSWKLVSRALLALSFANPLVAIGLLVGPIFAVGGFLEIAYMYLTPSAMQVVRVEKIEPSPYGDRLVYTIDWKTRRSGLVLVRGDYEMRERGVYVDRSVSTDDLPEGWRSEQVLRCVAERLEGVGFKTATFEYLHPGDGLRIARQLSSIRVPAPYPIEIVIEPGAVSRAFASCMR